MFWSHGKFSDTTECQELSCAIRLPQEMTSDKWPSNSRVPGFPGVGKMAGRISGRRNMGRIGQEGERKGQGPRDQGRGVCVKGQKGAVIGGNRSANILPFFLAFVHLELL